MNKRTVALVAAIPVTAVVLAACGSSDNDSSNMMSGQDMPMMSQTAEATDQTHNAADVTFAQEMIPHHQQAVVMAQMATAHASSAKVKALAKRIESAQSPEIEKMTGWLEAWGATVPSGSTHMGHEMSGMMSDSDMTALRASTGGEFDAMFLTMMIEHHEGAIAMANTELAKGSNAQAQALATAIRDAQTAEIAEMKALLAQGA
jgi:uncharacterized protein (DUF305 family)